MSGQRVVKAQRHLRIVRGSGEHGGDIPLIRCPGDLIVRQGRVKHAEPVVVFGGKDHVPHSGVGSQPDPGLGSNCTGLNRLYSPTYSASVMFQRGEGRMMGQDASTLASE